MKKEAEEILSRIINDHPFQGFEQEQLKMAIEAMHEYAAQLSNSGVQTELEQLRERNAQLQALVDKWDKLTKTPPASRFV